MNAVRDLVKIKDMIDKGSVSYEKDETIMQKIKELDKKIDSMKDSFQREHYIKKSNPESPVKKKRKREIIKLLESHKKLTSTQLSVITGISRTRCNEYLRELEEQGMANGTVSDKRKFYRLVKWER